MWFLLCQICLLAEELGNNEGRLGRGEGIFCERGNRGRQADPRHQPKIRWGAPTPKGGGTGVTGVVDRSAQRTVSRAESFPHKGETRSCRVSTMQSQGQPKLGPRLRAARSVFSEPTTIPMHHQYLCYCVGP